MSKGRLSNSNWFITINTNQRFDTYDDARPILRELQIAIKSIFQNLSQYVKFKPAELALGHAYNSEYIDRVRVKQGVEFSESRGLAHVHFMIAIRHKSKIQLDYQKIQDDVRQHLADKCPECFRVQKPDGSLGEPKTLYFYSKVYRDAAANFESYIDKDQGVRRNL